MRLKTETDTTAMANRILTVALGHPATEIHDVLPVFEHGQWWLNCSTCGAQWSVCDAEGGPAVDGFDFERVTEGDGYCTEEDR